MSNTQINEPRSGITNGPEATLDLSSNIISDSNGQANFPLKSLLTDTKNSRLCKAFAGNLSVNIKLSIT